MDKPTEYIKVEVSCEGDRSVGIWGEQTEVLIDKRFISGNYGDEVDCRKFIRDTIATMFKELFDDGSTRAVFEDECYWCGKPKNVCKCPDEYK